MKGSVKRYLTLPQLASSPNPGLREKAIPQLSKIRSASSRKMLRDLASDSDTRVRYKAIEFLAAIRDKKAISIIEEHLADPSDKVQRGALIALAEIGRRSSVPKIENYLRSSNPYVRGQAARTLAALGSRKSYDVLKNLLSDPDETVRVEARRALGSISGNKFELYQENLSDPEFISKKRSIVRREQEKTGSSTVLLGGKFFGKVIIRTIPKNSYELWVKAFEAGLPVEPILRRKDSKYRAYEESSPGGQMVRVSSGVIQGPSVHAFLMNNRNRRLFGSSIARQMRSIKKQLDGLGIVHGHFHDRNFIVRMISRNGARVPKIFLIDFDSAFIS